MQHWVHVNIYFERALLRNVATPKLSKSPMGVGGSPIYLYFSDVKLQGCDKTRLAIFFAVVQELFL